MDIFHWAKQLIAISLGVAFGFTRVTGWAGFASLILILIFLSNLYIQYAEIPDDVMSPPEALQEGLMPAIMSFTVRGRNFTQQVFSKIDSFETSVVQLVLCSVSYH